jgi:hypothetical protein
MQIGQEISLTGGPPLAILHLLQETLSHGEVKNKT